MAVRYPRADAPIAVSECWEKAALRIQVRERERMRSGPGLDLHAQLFTLFPFKARQRRRVRVFQFRPISVSGAQNRGEKESETSEGVGGRERRIPALASAPRRGPDSPDGVATALGTQL